MAKRRSRGPKLDTLLRETAAPVFLLNADREVVFFNAACELLVGRQADQVLGLCCRYHGPGGSTNLAELAGSLAPPPEVMAGRPMALETLIIRPDGAWLRRQIHFFPCHDATRTSMTILGLLTEPTDGPLPVNSPTSLHEGLLRLRDRLYQRFGIDKLIGSSDCMARVIAQIRLAARSDANVMIWGEQGTGKRFVARTIHAESERKSAPFVPMDCALLPPELTERDLLGASRQQPYPPRAGDPSLMRAVRGGTLFLENFAAMARDTQSRLLDLLSQLQAQASNKATTGHIRMIVADVSDPAQLLDTDQIRRDVFYSLSTIMIGLPPLRDRKEDVPLLAQSFVELANADGKKQVSGLSAEALELLLAYDWPENVRELRDVVAQAHAHCTSNLITADDLTRRIQGAHGGESDSNIADARLDLDAMLAATERRMIEQAIKRARGNKSAAADMLSITRARLYRRMQLLGMDLE